MTTESTTAAYYASEDKYTNALESAESDFAQELADEEWMYEDSYYNTMHQEYEHTHELDDKPSGVVINGFELTIGELRNHSGYDELSNETYDDLRDELYFEELEDDFRIDDLGVDPSDEEIYDGGFHRIVKSKRDFS